MEYSYKISDKLHDYHNVLQCIEEWSIDDAGLKG